MSRFVPPADDFLMSNDVAELVDVNAAGEFQQQFPESGWKWDDSEPSSL